MIKYSDTEAKNEFIKRTVDELEKKMQCNCDLDKWEPERDTGHSFVCRIHIETWRRLRIEMGYEK